MMLVMIAMILESVVRTAAGARPNFLVIVADDLGFYDTSVTNPSAPTPTIGNLSREGLRLDRHYVFRYCSPTRRSLLTGRFPNHITTVQPDGVNLCSDVCPLNATLISEKLEGYASFFIGKGHLGVQTDDHLPIRRGFERHVGFLAGSETYSHGGGSSNATLGKHDMWTNTVPGQAIVPGMSYATNFYTRAAVNILENRQSVHPSLRRPFFMYFAVQNVHTPYELPPEWERRDFPAMWNNTYANMLSVLDSAMLNLTRALHRTNEWNNTLILWTSDNGGIGLGNNYPLRGRKHDPWEGGTRVTAFLSGGVLPTHVRGTTSNAFVHVSDWWPTFCGLAGIDDCTDRKYFSKDGLLHDIDGVDVWPLLTNANATQPRALTPTSEVSVIDVSDASRWYKLITLAGQSVYFDRNQSTRSGTNDCLDGRQPDPPQPGRTDALVSGCPVCNITLPCLFDVLSDPNETNNIAASFPDVVERLKASILRFQTPYVSGTLTESELQKYDKIEDPATYYSGYLGPCFVRGGSGGGT